MCRNDSIATRATKKHVRRRVRRIELGKIVCGVGYAA
nr:MAG TPA: hypothetical protein [Caudoviricetes sp.]